MTFYYWLRRYRRGQDESNFLPVEISSGSHIEIHYPEVVILQLPAETRLSTLKQLLTLRAAEGDDKNIFYKLKYASISSIDFFEFGKSLIILPLSINAIRVHKSDTWFKL